MNNQVFTTQIGGASNRLPLRFVILVLLLLVGMATDFKRFTDREIEARQNMLPVNVAVQTALWPGLDDSASPMREHTYHLPNTSASLLRYFHGLGFQPNALDAGNRGVPRVFVNVLPDDFTAMEDMEARKGLFIRMVLPLVLKENERLQTLRDKAFRLAKRLENNPAISPEAPLSPAFLSPKEAAWLKDMSRQYKVKASGSKRKAQAYGLREQLAELLRRLDEVPASLALAQAAKESGWGGSRFVRQGNALFGQWIFSKKGEGIAPLNRPQNATYRIRSFDSLGESVKAYVHNLNTHYSYQSFRLKREALRKNDLRLDGLLLAAGLRNYSILRDAYVKRLRTLMRQNDLPGLDHLELSRQGVAGLTGSPRPTEVNLPSYRVASQ